MAGTRSSARIASTKGGSNPSSSPNAAGTKRKNNAGSSPTAKRGKKGAKKDQKTIEQTMKDDTETDKTIEQAKDEQQNGDAKIEDEPAPEIKAAEAGEDEANGDVEMENAELAKGEADNEKKDVHTETSTKTDDPAKVEPQHDKVDSNGAAANGDSAVEPKAREDKTPSSIMEKGLIYFFFRGRVGVDEPQTVDDIARSYIVVRPVEHGAELGDGQIGDAGNSRLFAVPKKVLPLSGKDRFMTFVEKVNVTFESLKNDFISASDYMTKTAGARHTPAATPVGEGVYAITTTGRESHLAYILTIPSELGEVQKEIGLKDRGSFIISTKNPETPAPGNASLPHGPDYPKEIMDEFRSLRWMPTQPKHLNFVNAQFLLIGESGGINKATAPQPEDEKEDKEKPLDEMEKLEEEDEHRVEGLKGDHAVFTDLELSSKDYPKLQTTW